MTNATFFSGHALLIGVGADLPVTVKDATALRDVLVDPTRAAYPLEQVELLTEAKATRQAILEAFDRLIERVNQNPDAMVIVYFSGHGGRITSLDNPPEYFLVPYGFDWNIRTETAISGWEFTEKIEAIKAKKLVVILDCCHAGGVPALKTPDTRFTKLPVPPSLLSSLESGSGRVVIASSDAEQYSYTGNPYSVFTACLLEALQGKASVVKDGYARILNILSYLFDQVPKRTAGKQKPFVNKVLNLSDDFPLCYYAGGYKEPKRIKFIDEEPIFEPVYRTNPLTNHNAFNQEKIKRLQKDIEIEEKQYDSLTRKIEVIVKRLATVIDPVEKDSLKERKAEFEEERELVEQKIHQLQTKIALLTQ
ncbi:caspase family protein [Microseira wollei]|uniref:Peptidase C14, caspase catalytic subunit p20 n=1 Tax=Microseira wollei NIES-4236 TaxID=2530354 RepID=A0AAV3XFP3_9CYAN|nr:caspase family protein [Microseira wollei]GET41073.1 peptidase C14, caspase catalytic subunit p20 [Microseira wollei NIES-4236]